MTATRRVLIVADDLTGAMDTAGPFAAQGLATAVVVEPLTCDPATVAWAEVVALNTASRHLAPDAAARRVGECAARFASPSFAIVFKKIDSTLRGNVAVETLALMQATARRGALVSPAFPAQGRTVSGAMVQVKGTPLPQTSFARDALSPPPIDPLDQVFEALPQAPTVACWRRGDAAPSADAVTIADAASDEDVTASLQSVGTRLDQVLLVGSAGLGLALARTLAPARGRRQPLPSSPGTIVFVVGSRAPQSRAQVERLRDEAGSRVIEAPNGMVRSLQPLDGARQVVILAVPDPTRGEGDASQVADALSRAALDAVRASGSGMLVATGGDTAIALLKASGCAALEVMGDLMPGIPYARIALDDRSLWLVTKAGGFGDAGTFVDIARRARAAQ